VKHYASPEFWSCFEALPQQVQELARRNYKTLKQNPRHPSLHFKTIGRYRSVRVGLHYRSLGLKVPEGVLWFWIGSHSEYDKLVRG
jgi:hypothetical protein